MAFVGKHCTNIEKCNAINCTLPTAKYPRLVEFNLCGARLTDETFFKLNAQLQVLSLEMIRMDVDIGKILRHLPNLQMFTFDSEGFPCRWTDVSYFAEMPQLKALHLTHTPMDAVVRMLNATLNGNGRLETLELNYAYGKSDLTCFNRLNSLKSLKLLHVPVHGIERILSGLLECNAQLEKLELSDENVDSNNSLTHLIGQMTTIKDLQKVSINDSSLLRIARNNKQLVKIETVGGTRQQTWSAIRTLLEESKHLATVRIGLYHKDDSPINISIELSELEAIDKLRKERSIDLRIRVNSLFAQKDEVCNIIIIIKFFCNQLTSIYCNIYLKKY